MKKHITSTDEILKVCMDLVAKNDISRLSMRGVASECNIALGSLYNYFPSKADLVCSTVESIWQEIFIKCNEDNFDNLMDYISCLFDNLQTSKQKYPNFFTMHAVGFGSDEKSQGLQRMHLYFDNFKRNIIDLIENDKNVDINNFKKGLTCEKFSDYIVTLVVSSIIKDDFDKEPLVELIKKVLYK